MGYALRRHQAVDSRSRVSTHGYRPVQTNSLEHQTCVHGSPRPVAAAVRERRGGPGGAVCFGTAPSPATRNRSPRVPRPPRAPCPRCRTSRRFERAEHAALLAPSVCACMASSSSRRSVVLGQPPRANAADGARAPHDRVSRRTACQIACVDASPSTVRQLGTRQGAVDSTRLRSGAWRTCDARRATHTHPLDRREPPYSPRWQDCWRVPQPRAERLCPATPGRARARAGRCARTAGESSRRQRQGSGLSRRANVVAFSEDSLVELGHRPTAKNKHVRPDHNVREPVCILTCTPPRALRERVGSLDAAD